MIIDFERAEFYSRQPLGLISPNSQSRKRKWEILQKQGKDPVAEELQFVVETVSRCFGGGVVPGNVGLSASGTVVCGMSRRQPVDVLES